MGAIVKCLIMRQVILDTCRHRLHVRHDQVDIEYPRGKVEVSSDSCTVPPSYIFRSFSGSVISGSAEDRFVIGRFL